MMSPPPQALDAAAIVQRWRAHQADLTRLARTQGSSREPRLMVVTKFHPSERVAPLVEAGCGLFGENYVQESLMKWQPLRAAFAQRVVEVHLIGPLQSNKLAVACEHFDAIQTIDRLKLIEACARRQASGQRVPSLYIQVNVGDEPQKHGASWAEAATLIDKSRAYGLPIVGVMTIPPVSADPAPHFERLRDFATHHALPEVSMGMSQDYALAIAYGATMVRIGTAIMGSRPPRPPVVT